MQDKEVINTHILAVFDRLLEMGYTLQQVVDAARLQVREFDLLLDTQFAQAHPLNDAEMNALRTEDNFVDIFRRYRDRTKCSPSAAHRAIDLARNYLAGQWSDEARITQEYLAWMRQYGNGRNKNDLRFGQYICNLLGINNNAVFNQEDATTAYNMLIEGS